MYINKGVLMRNIAKTRKDFFIGCYNGIMEPSYLMLDGFFKRRVDGYKADLEEMHQRYLENPDALTDEDCDKIGKIYIDCVLTRDEGLSDLNVKVDNEEICGGEDAEEGYLDGLNSLDTGELFFAFSVCAILSAVNVIFYVEDGQVKLYAPEKGNQYCHEHNCAFGEEPAFRRMIDGEDKWDDGWEEKYKAEIPKIDMNKELDDIADYFHNRKEGHRRDGTLF